MGSRFVQSDGTLNQDSQHTRYSHVSSPRNLLPVLGSGDMVLGYVSVAAAQRMLSAGSVVGRGTRHRIRALIATHDNIDLLPASKPPSNQRYSHNHETVDNPPGVWTFKKLTNQQSLQKHPKS